MKQIWMQNLKLNNKMETSHSNQTDLVNIFKSWSTWSWSGWLQHNLFNIFKPDLHTFFNSGSRKDTQESREDSQAKSGGSLMLMLLLLYFCCCCCCFSCCCCCYCCCWQKGIIDQCPISYPEPSNFLRHMLDENEGLWKGPVLNMQIVDLLYCIAFQITNQDLT